MNDPPSDLEPFRRYLMGRRGVSESSAVDYLRGLRRIARHAGVSLFELRVEHLEELLAEPLSWQSKNQSMVAFRQFHRWGARRGLWDFDPELEEMRLGRRPRRMQLSLTLDQAAELLEVADDWAERRLVCVGLYTGLRLAEISSLDRHSWVTRIGGDLALRVHCKGEVEREVPVHHALEELRGEIVEARHRRHFQRAAIRLRSHLGVDLTPHTLRRTFGLALSEAGVERDVIGALLGHIPSGVTVTHYVPVRWQEQAAAIQRVNYQRADGTASDFQLALF